MTEEHWRQVFLGDGDRLDAAFRPQPFASTDWGDPKQLSIFLCHVYIGLHDILKYLTEEHVSCVPLHPRKRQVIVDRGELEGIIAQTRYTASLRPVESRCWSSLRFLADQLEDLLDQRKGDQ